MLYCKPATGKAKCKLCGEIIKEGTKDVYFSKFSGTYYNVEEHYHKKCIMRLK